MSGERASTVVGGGIAGLASAVALAQVGWRVTVLERAPAFGEGSIVGWTARAPRTIGDLTSEVA